MAGGPCYAQFVFDELVLPVTKYPDAIETADLSGDDAPDIIAAFLWDVDEYFEGSAIVVFLNDGCLGSGVRTGYRSGEGRGRHPGHFGPATGKLRRFRYDQTCADNESPVVLRSAGTVSSARSHGQTYRRWCGVLNLHRVA